MINERIQYYRRRLEQAECNRSRMCSCSCGCEASPYYDAGARWPECDCWCHVPIWRSRLKELGADA